MLRHTLIPLKRFPQVFPVVTSIILVQTIVFVMILLSGKANDPSTWGRYGAFVGWRIDEGEYWRLIFSLFVHVDFMQLFVVALSIYILAPQLEWFFGKLPFLFLFLVTGFFGNLGVYLMGTEGVYTGAFESIYGLVGVYLFLYIRGMIHPLLGRGLLVILIINLVFDYHFLFAHILALLSGFVFAAIFIQYKQMKENQDSEQ
ncbi:MULTISPECIES: rhomboid family intramembrane serine protease [Thermoactinomyces]|jgi:rhomboid protease GluP|uniref:Rhomboid family intramembrane serine protease n=1 Tax=Thermoactinomyces daqus TaxID=1329516 RepID=A0A7W2AHC6_9BACL|nr:MULTISPECIES: rhomboid family intramembrane serine protease [Thermoactinomyces]MBA4541708.1 rhomboid family intramembrane serine protease [Thermoactinomyces daqus]MBH8597207.1 rhomboid family intramembrane serine protease [Thermoactinomyces sp. CICC 10523]MBH8602767.1 rhomboid family intramembrane serine protease [Thermoactinomyces sp. CICC 10522]MBH8606124.1 rhomboid family intramembrane serine protease [Thermoactinomyces sp. CICC 10521]